MILVNGRPLVKHALRHARRDWEVDRMIMVVSPENIRMIKSVVNEDHGPLNWVVQVDPKGVVDAINCAMPYVTGSMTLILCADNTFELNSWPVSELHRRVHERIPTIATRLLDHKAAKRFTRIVQTEEGIQLFNSSDPVDSECCWIGPLLLETNEVHYSLNRKPGNVVEFIRYATCDGETLDTLPMKCEDHGVPDELP